MTRHKLIGNEIELKVVDETSCLTLKSLLFGRAFPQICRKIGSRSYSSDSSDLSIFAVFKILEVFGSITNVLRVQIIKCPLNKINKNVMIHSFCPLSNRAQGLATQQM